MSLKGWGIALLLMPLTLGASLWIYGIIWFLSKIGGFYIKAMSFSIKATIGLIAYPFKLVASILGTSFDFIEMMYYQGVHNIKNHDDTVHAARRGRNQDIRQSAQQGRAQRLEGQSGHGKQSGDKSGFVSKIKSGFSFIHSYKYRYIALFLAITSLMGYPTFVMSLVQDPASLLTVSGLIDFLPMFFILALPFVAVIIISALAFEFFDDGTKFYKASDAAVARAKRLSAETAATAGAATAAVGAAAGAAREGAATAVEGAKAANDAKEFKEITGDIVEGASHASTAKNLVTGGGAAATEGAAAEGAATGLASLVSGSGVASALGTAAPIAVVLVVAWIVYTLAAAIISLILVVITWGYIAQILPMLAGAVMPILGLGEAYGQWFGQSVGNTVGPQLDGAFEEEKRMVAQMGAKIGCALEGPQCLRQWRLNNTVRPGSDARGETYELRIDRFRMAQNNIDVAYKERGYTLPISFLVYNTRHGLKGINARNVSYKISVEDANNQGKNAYCSTGWKNINTSTGNYILPGLGVSPTRTLEELNLGNCGLLQPSMGVNRVLEMQVKYDYSSQATLYFDAMSRQHRREQGLSPDFTKSETAKTPVQSYINVQSPVTYYETEQGERRAVPFPARFGFDTPGFDIEYRVDPDSIKISDSVLTEHIDGSCEGLENTGGDSYEISDRAYQRISDRQNDTWFDRSVDPAPLRCTFKLTQEGLNSINPTGEQLIMRIDSNYTIVRQKQHSSFSMVNTRCNRMNCPLLVTESYNNTHSGAMYTTCNYGASVDSYGGCSVIEPSKNADYREDDGDQSQQESDINWKNPNIGTEIEQGETAKRASQFVSGVTSSGSNTWENPSYTGSGSQVLGVNNQQLTRMRSSNNGFIAHTQNGELEFQEVGPNLCRGDGVTEDRMSTFTSIVAEDINQNQIMVSEIETADCATIIADSLKGYECAADLSAELLQQSTGWNTFVEGGGVFGNTETACHELYQTATCESDGGVLVSRNYQVECLEP